MKRRPPSRFDQVVAIIETMTESDRLALRARIARQFPATFGTEKKDQQNHKVSLKHAGGLGNA